MINQNEMSQQMESITCNTVSLSQFITCWIDRKYEVLSADLSESDCAIAWQKIYTEYLHLTENLPTLKALSIIDQIGFWKRELMIIEAALMVLPGWRSNELVQLLREKGYNFNFNQKDEVSYQKDVKRVAARSKKIIADIQELERELEGLQRESKGESYTRQDFINDIIIVSKFMGYHIDKEVCTVAEYAAMTNALHKHNEMVQNVK